MKSFGVKELTKLSGVSVRTLHYYDKIGLLKPANRNEAGYRFYGEQELLRLQQILFYRELDFPLKEIIELIDEPDYDLIEALNNHKAALRLRQKRISKLLKTIDNTIQNLKKETIMAKPEMLYEGLPKEFGTTYRKEAIDKYGKKTIDHAEKELLNLGKKGFEELKKLQQQNWAALFALRKQDPKSVEVQKLIAQHYQIIRKFWGSSNATDKQAKAYAGLGEMYVSDERFTTINDTPQPEFALFLKEAMAYFAETQLNLGN